MSEFSVKAQLKGKLDNLSADRILFNANVITMNPQHPRAEAVAIKNGKIIGVGSNSEMKQFSGSKTENLDLKGKTLLPGFIETHTHMIVNSGIIRGVDVGPSTNKSIDDILIKIKQRAEAIPEGTWIIGWGYDDTAIAENRHPNRWDFDKAAPNHPVCLQHVSGHVCSVNSKALEMAGITKDTPNPIGGDIYRDANGEPTGLLAELPAQKPVLDLMVELMTLDYLVDGLRLCNDIYLKAGVTSIHDAGVGFVRGPLDLLAYEKAISNKDLLVRVNGMIANHLIDMILDEEELSQQGICTGCGDDKLKIGAAKIVQGGSIQALTAALLEPYQCDPSNTGILIYPQEKLNEMVLKYHKAGFQIAIHANGDREVESVLEAYEAALDVLPRANHRHRIEHCQMANEDQLQRMGKLGVTASFFPFHVYNWGDRHRDIFIGPERAARIDPLQSALNHGVIFGFHNDTPVTPVDPLKSLYAAVARETSGGHVLGTEQAISVTEALKALTINAAYLAFEENIKGSIEIGKLADFVAISEDPYRVTPTDLKDLQIELTIVDGKVVYQRN